LLAAIVTASAAVRLLAALAAHAPWIFPDELVYTELARNFAATGHFMLRGEPFAAWSFGPLYPIVIAPAYRFLDPTTAYAVVKGINCLLFSLAAIPAYLLGRRFLARRQAITLAALAVVVPSGVYTSKVMTEPLAYLLFGFAALACVRVFERRTWTRELIALLAITAATFARAGLVVLFPAFLATLIPLAIDEERSERGALSRRAVLRRLGAYRLTWTGASLATIAAVLLGSTHGAKAVAGAHAQGLSGVRLGAILESFAYHIAELDLYVAVIPFAAAAYVLAYTAPSRTAADRQLRALCVFTIAATTFLAAEAAQYLVAVYASASHPYPRVYDRYEFYAAPLFFLIFLAWVDRGLPRPSARLTATLAVGSAALPASLPLAHLLNGREWGTSSSSVALVPWAILRALSGSVLPVYAVFALVAAGLASLMLRSRRPRLLLGVLATNLAIVNLFVAVGNSAVTRRARASAGATPAGRMWIDSRLASNAIAVVLWPGEASASRNGSVAVWEAEFFNTRIARVYDLREPMRYDLPQVHVHLIGHSVLLPNGQPLRARYLLTHKTVHVLGTAIAADPTSGMTLYRVDGAVQLR
jgi:hypothetical protein